MVVVCTGCFEELANVEVLFPFSAAVSCGKCGATAGHKFDVGPGPVTALAVKPTSAETKDGRYFVDGNEVTRPEFDNAIAQL